MLRGEPFTGMEKTTSIGRRRQCSQHRRHQARVENFCIGIEQQERVACRLAKDPVERHAMTSQGQMRQIERQLLRELLEKLDAAIGRLAVDDGHRQPAVAQCAHQRQRGEFLGTAIDDHDFGCTCRHGEGRLFESCDVGGERHR